VLLCQTTSTGWRPALLTLVATGLFLSNKVHPLLVLAGAGLLGVTGMLGGA